MKKHAGKSRMGGPVKLACSHRSEYVTDDGEKRVVGACIATAIGLKGHIGRRHRQCTATHPGCWKEQRT